MSKLSGLWVVNDGFHKGAKVMEHTFRDDTKHYTMRDRLGRPSNIKNKAEAEKIIKAYEMVKSL